MRYKRRSKEFSSLGVLDYLQTLTDESWDGLSAAGRQKADNFVQLASAEYRRVGGMQIKILLNCRNIKTLHSFLL